MHKIQEARIFAGNTMTVTSTPELIKNILQTAAADTFVLWDVDYVLINQNGDEFSISRDPIRQKLWTELKARSTPEQMRRYYGALREKTTWSLMDREFPAMHLNLLNRKVPHAAFTALETGAYGNIPSLEDWRIKHLLDFGYDFRDSCSIPDMEMADLAEGDAGIPMKKAGVIFSAQVDKGKIFERVFQGEHKPKRIIFIDDDSKNLLTVMRAAEKLGIPCHAIHYTAIDDTPRPMPNAELESLRFQVLEQEGIYLNNNELRARMAAKDGGLLNFAQQMFNRVNRRTALAVVASAATVASAAATVVFATTMRPGIGE